MNNYFKFFIVFFLSSFCTVYAAPNIKARTAILIDYQSDKILFELQPDHSIHPASMTKIMTTIVVFDLLQKKKYPWMIKLQYLKKLGECPRLVIHLCL